MMISAWGVPETKSKVEIVRGKGTTESLIIPRNYFFLIKCHPHPAEIPMSHNINITSKRNVDY